MACGTEVVTQRRDVHPRPVLTPPTLSGGPGVGLQLSRLMEQHTRRVPSGRWFQASQINEYSKIARCHGNSEPPFVCCWKLRRSIRGSGRAVNRLSGGVRLCAAGASRAFDGICDTVSGQTAARTASGGRDCPRAVAVHASPRLVPLLSSHVSSQCGHALSIGFVCPFPALTAR